MARYLLTVILIVISTAFAQAEKRVALVIGNADYEAASPLANPLNDAADMAKALQRLKFEVVLGTDLSYDSMRKKLREFTTKLEGADVALFFYAGHAVQVDGTNYLAPIDTELSRKSDLEFETIALDTIQEFMERDAKTQIVFLDACRDNPLTRSLRLKTRSTGDAGGLARPKISPEGAFIAFSTQPGNVALDGTGRNSPFTKALLNNIERQGIEISALMTDVRREVYENTGTQQLPWTNSGMLGHFYFNDAGPADVASTRPPASKPDNGETDRLRKLDEEKLAWDGVDKEDYQDVKHFLDRYPDGFLSFVAKSQLDLLDRTNRATRQAEETNKGAAQDDRLASLQTQESPRESLEQPMTTEMVRSIQTELNRLGCQAGTVDGQWGNNSRKALRKYGDELGIELASTDPSARLLDELRAKSKRVCPLVCGPRYDVSGDQCVLKSCPSGQQLSSKGACYTPSRTATSGSSRSSSGASKPLSSNCFMFNGKKVCE